MAAFHPLSVTSWVPDAQNRDTSTSWSSLDEFIAWIKKWVRNRKEQPGGSCWRCQEISRSSQTSESRRFCSNKCWLNYSESVQRIESQNAGYTLCSLPGCKNSCYTEPGGKTHPYCGKTHATLHRSLREHVEREKASAKDYGSFAPTQTAESTNGHAGRKGTKPRTRGNKETDPIYFYNKFEKYYEFTNFYPAVILLGEEQWHTSEHYFQAQKFIGTPVYHIIRKSSSPREAFDISRNPAVSPWCRPDWQRVKDNIMRKALLAKFIQHEHLRKLLMSTGGRELVERSPYDSYWGDGGNGKGKNMLGKLLMEIRDEILLTRPCSLSPHRETGQSTGSTDKEADKFVVIDGSDAHKFKTVPEMSDSGVYLTHFKSTEV